MFSKVWKVFKEVSIGILLVLSLWLVILGAWGKDYMGNLSDWVSSMSTFGTLIVAYFAFRSAPLWIKTKNNELALGIATALITEKMVSISNHNKVLINRVTKIEPDLENLISGSYLSPSIYNFVHYFEESYNDLKTQSDELIRLNFRLLGYKWKVNKTFESDFKYFILSRRSQLSLVTNFINLYNEICNLGKPLMQHEKEIFENHAYSLQKYALDLRDNLSNTNRIIYNFESSGKSPDEIFYIPLK